MAGRLLIAGIATLWACAAAGPASAAPGWTSTFDLSATGPDVAMAPDGTTVYPGTMTVDSKLRAAVQVRPPGGPVGAPQLLSLAGASVPGQPIVASGPDGRTVIVWVEDGIIRTATLAPGTTSFGPQRLVPAGGDSNYSLQDIALDAAGNAHVLWETSTTSNTLTTFYLKHAMVPADGSAIASPTIVDSIAQPSQNMMVSVSGARIAVTGAGAALAAWVTRTTDTNVQMTQSSVRAGLKQAGQTVFSTSTLEPVPGNVQDVPAVAFNSAGQGGVAWIANPAAMRFRPASSTAIGSTNENPIVSGGSAPLRPALAMRPDGTAVAAWLATVSGTSRPQASVRSAGGTWAAAQTLTPDVSSPFDVALVTGTGGDTLLGVGGSTAGKCTSAAAALPSGAATFASPSTVGTPLSGGCAGAPPALAVGPGGDAVLRRISSNFDAAGYDVSPPQLLDVSIPGTGTAGTAVGFSARPVDIWGPVTTAWAFGDTGTADGTAPAHTFADAGDRTVSVTATDAFGHASTASGPISIAAPATTTGGDGTGGTTGGTGGTGTTADTIAPVLANLRLTHRTFAVGRAPTPLATAARVRPSRGTTLRFTLSEPGTVTIAFKRELPGRRLRGKPCAKPTAANRSGKRCTRLKTVGTLTRAGVLGANRVPFSGRLGTRPLTPGHYRAIVRARDAAGNVSKRAIARFRIVR